MKKIFYTLIMFLFIASNAYAVRHYERDFYGHNGNGYVTLDVTDIIVFKITLTKGYEFFCDNPESIVQSGKQWDIDTYCYDVNCIEIVWENFDGCGYIYEGVTAIGTMDYFPSTFNIWDAFRLWCGIWKYDDYFDVEAEPNPPTTTISTTTSILITTTTTTSYPFPCPAERIYGEDSEKAELLRYIRDEILSQSPEGREIIKLYYQWSSVIIKMMEEDPQLKEEIRELIDLLINKAQGTYSPGGF